MKRKSGGAEQANTSHSVKTYVEYVMLRQIQEEINFSTKGLIFGRREKDAVKCGYHYSAELLNKKIPTVRAVPRILLLHQTPQYKSSYATAAFKISIVSVWSAIYLMRTLVDKYK